MTFNHWVVGSIPTPCRSSPRAVWKAVINLRKPVINLKNLTTFFGYTHLITHF